MATVGTGKYTYDVIENWGKLPAGDTFGMVSAIATDSSDRVFAFQRKDPPMLIFDRDGNLTDSWGNGSFEFAPGIHPSAVIADSAQVAGTAHIGPNCVIGESAAIGEQTVLEANCIVGDHSVLGQAVRLFANVTIYSQCRIGDRVRIHAGTVIGSDGYGYVFDQDHHRKIPQVGGVVIENDVEIGANCTIDRGALGDTLIGEGTKIDNLVQIAHNVVIGKHCIIVAQNGIGGSAQIGEYSMLGGQVGILGHITIGPKAMIAAKSTVLNNLEGGKQYMGFPAIPNFQAKRQLIAAQQLPELIKRVRELEKQLANKDKPAADDA